MIPTGLVGVCIPLPKLKAWNVIRGLRRAACHFTSTEMSGLVMAGAHSALLTQSKSGYAR